MSEAVSGQRLAIHDDIDYESRGGTASWLRLVALAFINLFVALLWLGLLAWLIGRVFSDRFEWSQWLWWIPSPAALTAAALGWLLAFRSARTLKRRRKRILIWSACLITIAIHFSAFEHRLLRTAPAIADPQHALTIAHWNMTLDNYADIPGLMKSLDAFDADLIAITSPPTEIRRMLHERAAIEGSGLIVLDGYPMLLVSRLPITQSRVLISTDRSFLTRVAVDATARIGRSVSIMLVDLPSGPRIPRMATAQNLRTMLDDLNQTLPDIAIGDFNMTRNSASVAALFPGMAFAYNQAGHGYGATFHRRFPLYHIDHTLINEQAGLRAIRYDIRDEGQSRHCAQKAWIGRR